MSAGHASALVADTLRWLEAGPGGAGGVPRPFLLLTPLGLADPAVGHLFADAGVRPLEVRAVDDYPRASIPLYARRLTPARVRRGLAYEAAWRTLAASWSGAAWVLDEGAFRLAWRLKATLRRRWTPLVQGELLFRPFHLPDPDDVARQWAWLAALARWC